MYWETYSLQNPARASVIGDNHDGTQLERLLDSRCFKSKFAPSMSVPDSELVDSDKVPEEFLWKRFLCIVLVGLLVAWKHHDQNFTKNSRARETRTCAAQLQLQLHPVDDGTA